MTLHNDPLNQREELPTRDIGMIAIHVALAGNPGESLEIGCGAGSVSRALLAAGWQVIGVDSDPEVVREAQKHIQALVADIDNLPFSDHVFDLVVMRFPYGPSGLMEARRVLKPGGRMILTLPASEPGVPSTDMLKASGFKVEQTRHLTVRESQASEVNFVIHLALPV